MEEKWILQNKRGDFREIGETFGVDPLIGKLLVNRGRKTEEEIKKYLYGDLSALYEPELMKDAKRAADLLTEGIRKGEKIAIASDFDDDGIFSAYILKQAFSKIGADSRIYTPDRISEGYGLNERIIREAMQEDRDLLVTCDNGIAAREEIKLAKKKGLTVIVTDHHEVPFEMVDGEKRYLLPEGDAVVDPKRADCTYPFSGLCGAGVAFKVIQLLYRIWGIPDRELYELLPYVAIATVADVMDLTDENRILVKEGLKRLEHTSNLGLKALIEMCGLGGKKLTSYHMGFIIGPCFNAAGRLSSAKEALDLLEAETAQEASRRAARLSELNSRRKSMTEAGFNQAVELIEKNRLYEDPVMMVVLEGCHESLAGIIAGRIREKYYHPVYVFTRVKEGLKGSGRSIEGYSMYEKLSAAGPLLSRFGGHPMAAGLSLPEENFQPLKEKLCADAGLSQEDFKPVIKIDAAMPIQYVTPALVEQMDLLEPFGKENEKPLFAEQHFIIERMKVMGKNQNALKLTIRNRDGARREGVWFGKTEEFFEFLNREYGEKTADRLLFGKGEKIDVAFTYYPDFNEYRGVRQLQFVLKNYCRIS